jgi:hypothetical protein
MAPSFTRQWHAELRLGKGALQRSRDLHEGPPKVSTRWTKHAQAFIAASTPHEVSVTSGCNWYLDFPSVTPALSRRVGLGVWARLGVRCVPLTVPEMSGGPRVPVRRSDNHGANCRPQAERLNALECRTTGQGTAAALASARISSESSARNQPSSTSSSNRRLNRST